MKTAQILSFRLLTVLAFGLAINTSFSPAVAQGTAITYQGRLLDGADPVTGYFDLRFHVYSAATGGSVLGGPVTNAPVAVTNGLFTVVIDFGANVFTGSSNWLQVGVRTNGSTSAYTALSPRDQLTPTPYAIFAESASSAGLSGTIPDGSLSPDVALLPANQTFTGANSFSGDISLLDPTKTIVFPATSGANEPMMAMFSSGTDNADRMVIAHSLYYPTWGLQYQDSIDQFNFLTAGTPILSVALGAEQVYTTGNGVGIGTTAPQQSLSVFAAVNVDQANLNAGILNNGNTNGYGLTFGSASGEGIASERVAGANQYGLDFYTDFTKRMSIDQAGYVGIGRAGPIVGDDWLDVQAPVTNDWGGIYVATAGLGLPFYGYAMADGIYAWTWLDGSSGGDNSWNVYDEGGTLKLTTSGQLGVNTSPSQALEVNGNFALIDGANAANGNGPIDAYIGGNGSGSDVQIGSLNSLISNVAFYNWGNSTYMHVYCGSITIEGGADLAEPFKITADENEIPQGAVVVIDEAHPGQLKMSHESYDTHVAGVVSGAKGINPGIQMQQQGVLEGGKNVSLTGRVYVQADTSNGPIKPGDLLTTSGLPGHAMKVTDHARAAGAILGKAMTGLSDGNGMVLVLVTLQ
jgi:hypothetical protein